MHFLDLSELALHNATVWGGGEKDPIISLTLCEARFYHVHKIFIRHLYARKPPRTFTQGIHLYFIDKEVEALRE